MKSFEILPHTSDFRLKIRGVNMEELLNAALNGMNSVIKKSLKNSAINISQKNITINSRDPSMLLIDFLSEVLTLSHTKKSIFTDVVFHEIKNNYLNFSLNGFNVDGFDEDIKAVTYTETEINKNEDGLLEAIIVFDI